MRRNSLFRVVGILVFLTVSPNLITASTPSESTGTVPQIITSGVEAYKTTGAESAVKTWLKGGPLEGQKEALRQAQTMEVFEDYYGKVTGTHLILSRNLTETSKVVYVTLDFEKGPVFCKFTLYRVGKDWIVINFLFNTKESEIIPEWVWETLH